VLGLYAVGCHVIDVTCVPWYETRLQYEFIMKISTQRMRAAKCMDRKNKEPIDRIRKCGTGRSDVAFMISSATFSISGPSCFVNPFVL